jgi:tetratricopeptide (TPR) repeat protein
MNLQSLESELKKAIAVRESGKLSDSRVLFESLLEKTKKLLGKNSSKDLKYFYLTLMGEYVIQYRLEGVSSFAKGLEIGKEILAYDEENKVGNPLSLRSVSHTLQNMGSFEEAEPYFRRLVDLTGSDLFKQGEELAHLSLCVFRQGRLDEAEETIERAIEQISKNSSGREYPNVPYSRALTVKALILNAKGEPKRALKLTQESLSIAKKDKLVFRIKQAEKLIKFFQTKIKAQ